MKPSLVIAFLLFAIFDRRTAIAPVAKGI